MSPRRITILVLLAALVAAGCGSAETTSTARTPAPRTATLSQSAGKPKAFAWLHPAPAPPGWSVARLIGSTALAYPAAWHRIHSDPGTVSAVLEQAGSGLVTEYLNATPQQGAETLQDWARFRPDHNQEEGDRHEQVLASAQGLKFRDGVGSCVIDRYRTSRTGYQEIACIVRGSHGTSVIVAAALAGQWAQDAPLLERAVSAFIA